MLFLDADEAIEALAWDMRDRNAQAILSDRKLAIALQLIQKAKEAGAGSGECIDWLKGPELDLLLAMMGTRGVGK
jgi:hypothetical protein